MVSWKPAEKAILLIPNDQRSIIIGNRYSYTQIVKIGLALQGSVKLAGPLKKLLGNQEIGDTLKSVYHTAKGFWNTYHKDKEEDYN